jgi:glutathione synthase/RimK-type ligase-like ATP-grasp enzyme
VEQGPPELIDLAVRASALMGNGLYGVDLKQTDKGFHVIEVNDNPNIDHGVEDKVLGDALYTRVMEEFIQRIRALRGS